MERRNTIQKDMVLKAVKALHGHVTADEVYEQVKKDHPAIGRGTVYRNLGILTEEGKIRKVEIPDGPDRFDFSLHEHYHVRCVRCGKISDVDLEPVGNLLEHIKNTNGIKYCGYDILFKGICPDCLANEA